MNLEKIFEIEPHNASKTINLLRSNYLMTNREICALVDCTEQTLIRWKKGLPLSKENFDKLEKLKFLLEGKSIKYKKEAFDILMEARG